MSKATPLNAVHREAGARMVDFGGWDMPVNYGSQIEEHHAVRRDAGLFDISHMRVVDIEGAGTRTFLRFALANDVAKLTVPGKALYSCLLNDSAGVVDDLIAYFFRDDYFRLVVNAGTAEADIQWLHSLNALAGQSVAIQPREDLAMVAVQGPNARAKLWSAFPETKAGERGSCAVLRGAHGRHHGGAHRLHGRGWLRGDVSRGGCGDDLERSRRGRRAALRARRARHAPARGGHESLRAGHGRRHFAARRRARMDRRPQVPPSLLRAQGTREPAAEARFPRSRASRQGGRAAFAPEGADARAAKA